MLLQICNGKNAWEEVPMILGNLFSKLQTADLLLQELHILIMEMFRETMVIMIIGS